MTHTSKTKTLLMGASSVALLLTFVGSTAQAGEEFDTYLKRMDISLATPFLLTDILESSDIADAPVINLSAKIARGGTPEVPNAGAACTDGTELRTLQCGTGSNTTGANSVAVGGLAEALGARTTAIGANVQAHSDDVVSIGFNSRAQNPGDISIGNNARHAFQVGAGTSTGNATLIGADSQNQGINSVGIGAGVSIGLRSNDVVVIGQGATASGTNGNQTQNGSIVIGQGASSIFVDSIVFGQGATATAADRVTFGSQANGYMYQLHGIASATSSGAQDVGTVRFVTADAQGNLAVSNVAPGGGGGGGGVTPAQLANVQGQVTSNDTDIAALQGQVGTNTTNIGNNTTAIGNNNTAIGNNGTAITTLQGQVGTLNTNVSNLGTQVTNLATQVAGNATAVSNNAAAIQNLTVNTSAATVASNTAGIVTNATNIAGNTTLIAGNTAAISVNTTNIAGNTSRIGVNETAIATNVTNIAGNTTNIAANLVKIDANTAANTRQDATLVTYGNRLSANEVAIAGNTTSILENKTRIDAFSDRIDKFGAGIATNALNIDQNTGGIAVAMAMAGGASLSGDSKFGFGANWGLYGGEHAASFTMAARVTPQMQLNAGIGFTDKSGTTGARAGLWYEW